MLARTPKSTWLERLPFAGLLSFRYAALRGWTAGSALIAGLIQTFVFARVLEPERFSLFLLVGAFGVSMWLFDLGLPKILFVRLRKRFLAGQSLKAVAAQANAMALFYAALVGGGALACFALAAWKSGSLWGAGEFALFFLFSAFNLPWFVLRNVSVAIDEYIHFETLEATRRLGYIAAMLALLAGLPLAAFVVLINLGWAVLVALAIKRLVARRALSASWRGFAKNLRAFLRENRAAAWRTGGHAAGEVYIHNVLYLVVPVAFGLGAPTIIVDTALKIFFGTVNLCSAACDLMVPRQTAAYAEGDRHTLTRATILAFALCALPAAAVALILVIDAQGLFRLLLGPSATMPAEMTPILLVLLAVAVAKSAPNFLLQHTGYFQSIARISALNAAVMTVVLAGGLIYGLGVTGLFALYAAVFTITAVVYLAFAWRGPVRDSGR
jgi:O-antigen/teichoic acid export membrane protein